jgi:phospholipase C
MSSDLFARRRFLHGAGLVGGAAALAGLSSTARTALAAVAPAGSALRDIEHIVILCQENRSFDHYFGMLSGVAGFSDPSVQPDPVTGRTVFEQLDPNPLNGVGATMLPWRVQPATSAAQCMVDVDHSWQSQHVSYARGTNAAFMTSHTVADLVSDQDPTVGGARTMSYFARADLPFHYALADAFTVCDHYHCSVLGPTTPNRLYLMSATLDHEGTHGGPETNNLKYPNANFSWTTYPERLQAAGVDWGVYREADDYEDNVLDYFVQYQDTHTEIYRRGRSVIPPGQTAAKIRADVQSGNLPQVSWIIQNKANSEHPEAMPAKGAVYMQGILEALTSNPKVWAKTAFIITYDENGGFFDHVIPPTPPPGTPGEYLTPGGLAAAPSPRRLRGRSGLASACRRS